jgi:mannonate dehydratase
MIEIAELLFPYPSRTWKLVKQAGVDRVVGTLDYGGGSHSWMRNHGTGGDDQTPPPEAGRPWDYMNLVRLKTRYADAGFELVAIESSPPMDRARLGAPGRDEEIANVCELIRNMGKLGIPVWCYNWMAGINWSRTSITTPTRGGALATSYDHRFMRDAPLTELGLVDEERLWETLRYFLERVLPVAEEAGVRLAMHPDDPPLSPARGIGRIMRSVENFQRLVDLAPSPANTITFCQGNFALMTDDMPGAIEHFGAQHKIAFVHFRDVRGTAEQFVETFHDDGPTDMLACMRAYRAIGFEGVLRPDHVPTLEGESNDNPGYEALGRLFAIGYIRGLQEAVYGKRKT